MAEKSIIISAEEEAILLKPIDEYVGKIQEQIDALRVEGSDKVNSLKNQIAIAKENKKNRIRLSGNVRRIWRRQKQQKMQINSRLQN